MNLVISVLVLVVILNSCVCANPADNHESRKTSRPTNNNSPSLNSLSSSQDAPSKSQSNQQPPFNVRQSQHASTPAEYNSSQQPQSSIYTHLASNSQPPNTLPQGGYLLSVNANGGPSTPNILSSGPTPVIMQYLPQNQQSNGIQYLQLIPTRPLIVPISPYISHVPQYNAAQASPSSSSIPSTTSSTQYAPASAYTQGGQNYASYPGAYTTPIVSYFRPHSGIQLINAPVDMSLNTNEYIPIQGTSAFKMRRA